MQSTSCEVGSAPTYYGCSRSEDWHSRTRKCSDGEVGHRILRGGQASRASRRPLACVGGGMGLCVSTTRCRRPLRTARRTGLISYLYNLYIIFCSWRTSVAAWRWVSKQLAVVVRCCARRQTLPLRAVLDRLEAGGCGREQRVLCDALSEVVAPQRAAAVAAEYGSLGAIMEALRARCVGARKTRGWGKGTSWGRLGGQGRAGGWLRGGCGLRGLRRMRTGNS